MKSILTLGRRTMEMLNKIILRGRVKSVLVKNIIGTDYYTVVLQTDETYENEDGGVTIDTQYHTVNLCPGKDISLEDLKELHDECHIEVIGRLVYQKSSSDVYDPSYHPIIFATSLKILY